jgi:hypothetical protein
VKVNFFGSHFDIEVRAGKEVFKIRTSSGQYLPGETVYFSVEGKGGNG